MKSNDGCHVTPSIKIQSWFDDGQACHYSTSQPLGLIWVKIEIHTSTALTDMPGFYDTSSLLPPSWTSHYRQPTSHFHILIESFFWAKHLTQSLRPEVTSLWWRGSPSLCPLPFGALPSFQERMLVFFTLLSQHMTADTGATALLLVCFWSSWLR